MNQSIVIVLTLCVCNMYVLQEEGVCSIENNKLHQLHHCTLIHTKEGCTVKHGLDYPYVNTDYTSIKMNNIL